VRTISQHSTKGGKRKKKKKKLTGTRLTQRGSRNAKGNRRAFAIAERQKSGVEIAKKKLF